jgi:hypothetical protein
MAGSVTVVFVVEALGQPDDCSDLFLGELSSSLTEARLEASLFVDASRAGYWHESAPADFRARLKQMNVGLCLDKPLSYLAATAGPDGTDLFRKREHRGFLDVSAHAGHIPSGLLMETWAPQAMEVIGDWGTRVVFVPHGLIENQSRPYFLAGRLHVANLGPYWIDLSFQSLLDDEGRRGLEGQIARRVEQMPSDGGVIVLRLAGSQTSAALEANHHQAALGVRQLAETVRAMPRAVWQSARQMVDRWGDISYDVALATDFFREHAPTMAGPTLGPIRHELGYLSPAEQLSAIARIWLESIQKGKPARNVTLRSPLPPRSGSRSDASVTAIPASDLVGVLSKVVQAVDSGRLASSVDTSQGQVAIQDLLPSLASIFAEADLTQASDVPLVKGELPIERVQPSRWHDSLISIGVATSTGSASLAEAQQYVWTLKPTLFD